MGVPQRRERVFFVCQRNDLNFEKLSLQFNEKQITFKDVIDTDIGKPITGKMLKIWENRNEKDDDLGAICVRMEGKQNYFGSKLQKLNKVSNTIIASSASPLLHTTKPNHISKLEACSIGSFPRDYLFYSIEPKYLIGMSVPPVMTAQIANQIYLQWFKTENKQ
jgi:DNA (cytosine-5)-methyltransferase 1